MGRNCYWCRLYELLAYSHIYQQLVLLFLILLAVAQPSSTATAVTRSAAPGEQLTPHQLDQLYRQQELTRLKQRILEGLGLTKIPDVSKMNVSREEYERMYRVYLQSVEQQRRREQQETAQLHNGLQHPRTRISSKASPSARTARPQRFYSFPHSPSSASSEIRREKTRRKGTTWLYFPMQISKRDSEVSSASLRLELLLAAAHGHTLTLRVYQLLRADEESRGEPERLLIDQKELRSDVAGNRWTELDVSRAAQSWLRDPSSNLGLELQCRGCAAASVSMDTTERPSGSPLGPVLNVLTTELQEDFTGRGRRSIDLGAPLLRRTNCSSSGERCCRHSMEVVFKELEDFDFILQPTKYDAGYCKGRCPPRYNPASHHALLQSLVWKRDRSLAPRPCCAPSKLKSLQMLVLDADDPTKLRVVSWTEMEVEECACA